MYQHGAVGFPFSRGSGGKLPLKMDVEISKPLSVISIVLGTKLSTIECIQDLMVTCTKKLSIRCLGHSLLQMFFVVHL